MCAPLVGDVRGPRADQRMELREGMDAVRTRSATSALVPSEAAVPAIGGSTRRQPPHAASRACRACRCCCCTQEGSPGRFPLWSLTHRRILWGVSLGAAGMAAAVARTRAAASAAAWRRPRTRA